MQTKPILNVLKPVIKGFRKKIPLYAKGIFGSFGKASIPQCRFEKTASFKEKICEIVSQSEFLQSSSGQLARQRFLVQTRGDYPLLVKLLENKELAQDKNLLNSVLHLTNYNNGSILEKYLIGELKCQGVKKSGLISISKNQLNLLLALNRNNSNASKLAKSPKEITELITQALNHGQQFTTDLSGQNQIMEVLYSGSMNGGRTTAVLGENLLNDFENLVHGKPYFKKFINESMDKISSKVKSGEAFSIKGQMYVKEESGELVSLGYSEAVFKQLFPPVERFNICQGKSGDCFFLSPLNSLMETPKGRSEIYQMFRGSTPEQIVVQNARLRGEKFLFKEFEQTGYAMRNKHGLAILEQCQALCDYAEGEPISQIGDYNLQYVMRQFAGIPSLSSCSGEYRILQKGVQGEISVGNISELESALNYFSANPNTVFNFGTKSGKVLEIEGDLVGGHVYSIKGYDSSSKLVRISNPWHGGVETLVPLNTLDKFINYISTVMLELC